MSPPPPTGTKIAADVAELVAQDLVGDRALAGDDQRIVERVHERQAGLAHELVAPRLRLGVAVAGEDDLGAERAHGLHLDLGRRLRHDDERAQPEMPGRERHALRVVAGAGRDDASRSFRVGHVRDAVVGAAQLVAEDRLQILALEQDLVAQPARQMDGRLERRLVRDVVDAAGEDQPQHRVAGDVGSWASRYDRLASAAITPERVDVVEDSGGGDLGAGAWPADDERLLRGSAAS